MVLSVNSVVGVTILYALCKDKMHPKKDGQVAFRLSAVRQ